jgi:hypothetical protein
MDFGGAASALLPNSFQNGLSSANIIESDSSVIKAKREQDRIETKIELTEKKISALIEFRKIVQDIYATLEPLSALPSGGSVTLFGDYNIDLTSQDAKDPDKYLSVSRIEDNGTSLAFIGVEQKYKIYIKQLAAADSYDFNKSFASATTALGFTGTLRINDISFSILSNQSLNTIINNINDAQIGAFCTLIQNGDGTYNVSMRSCSTGEDYAFDLTDNTKFSDETDDGSGNRLFNGLSKNLDIITTHTIFAKNAIIKIDDSVDKVYQTNDITNALSGLEFNLLSANTNATSSVTIVLSRNVEKVTEAIIQYAAATNELNKFYKIQTYRKPDGKRLDNASLYDESSFDGMYNSLRGIIDSSSEGLSASDLKFLIQLGFVYKEQEESKDQDGNIIPKYLAFNLESATSVRDKVKSQFENVRKMFEIGFSSDDSGLKLLVCGNKPSESRVFNFSLIINNNNLTGNDALTGLPYDHTKKVAISYTNTDNANITVYPPIYEVNASGSGIIIKFPTRLDKAIGGYSPITSAFEGLTLFYTSVPTSNTLINLSLSQGSGNRVLNYIREMTKNAKLGGVIESAVNKLKDELATEKKKQGDNQEAVQRAEERASDAFNRKTASMGQASYNTQLLNAYSSERTKAK